MRKNKKIVAWVLAGMMTMGGSAFAANFNNSEGGLQGDAGPNTGKTAPFSWKKSDEDKQAKFYGNDREGGLQGDAGPNTGKTVPFYWTKLDEKRSPFYKESPN